MVPAITEASASRSAPIELATRSGDSAIQNRAPSAGEEAAVDGLSLVRDSLLNSGLSEQSTSMILSSWRVSTKKQYISYLHRWITFCADSHLNIFTKDVSHILNFLNTLYDEGLTYSAINTARSALSAFLGVMDINHIGAHPLVVRFMKGVSRSRPTLPRYSVIWDVKDVFTMFRQQPLVEFLSLYDLTLRTVTLLALVSAQRGQSIHMLDTSAMHVSNEQYVFHLHGQFKQARVGNETLTITLPAYKDDIRLCIVNTLAVYLRRTEQLRNSSKLFISTVKPHNAVSKDTIARWIKVTLGLAGIDGNVFKPHSTRAAATSAAKRKGVRHLECSRVVKREDNR